MIAGSRWAPPDGRWCSLRPAVCWWAPRSPGPSSFCPSPPSVAVGGAGTSCYQLSVTGETTNQQPQVTGGGPSFRSCGNKLQYKIKKFVRIHRRHVVQHKLNILWEPSRHYFIKTSSTVFPDHLNAASASSSLQMHYGMLRCCCCCCKKINKIRSDLDRSVEAKSRNVS